MKRFFTLAVFAVGCSGLIACTNLNTSLDDTQSVNQTAEQYVQLVLALGEHDSGYVDAYYGPQQYAQAAKAQGWSKTLIIAKAEALQSQLPAIDSQNDKIDKLRVHFLSKNLTALITHAQALSGGSTLDFDAQSLALYDSEAPHFDLTYFDAPLAEIEKMLPGDEPLYQRVEAFNRQFEIPADKLSIVFNRAIKECSDRSKVFITLADNENFDLEYVKNKSWGGYNWYKGNANSLIQVNTDFPIALSRAVVLGCHEGYPGHHAYNSMLEDELVNKRGWIEYTVYPLYSPQSLIAEGSANYGVTMAFPGDEKATFEKEVLYPLAGIDPALSDKFQKYHKLTEKLGYVDNEIARLYINGDIDKEKAITLIQKYRMLTRAKAEQKVSFIEAYGAYVINYNWGRDMVKAYIEQVDSQAERWQRFSRLLSSPRIPSSLNW